MAKLLLVDDDLELSGMLREYLEQDGFHVTQVHDGESGVREALGGNHDLIVLDVMMPGMSGVEVLSRVRAHSDMPVIMLTAKGDDVDRIIGLEMGADDYVPKPCTPRELAARIRAVLRRLRNRDDEEDPTQPIDAGPLRIYPQSRVAEWKTQPLELTSTEFNLLALLARQAGKAVSKGELSQYALGRPLSRFDRSIDVHVSRIRQKLGMRDDGQSWIQTIRNQGYQLSRD